MPIKDKKGVDTMPILAAVAVPHPPIILPEVGRGEEKKIKKTADAYMAAMKRIAQLKPDTIIITSPHSIMYRDYFHISPGSSASGNMGVFRAPNVKFDVDYDTEFVDELSKTAAQEGIGAGTLGERDASLDHGTMIPLYFLNKVYSKYKIVRIGLSGFSPIEHYRFGQCIAKACNNLGRKIVIIASGDLSHKLKEDGPYGFSPEGPQFDKQLVNAFKAGNFLPLLSFSPAFAEAAAECGLKSFQIMAGALDCKSVTHELLSYEGPFGVGYAVALFEVTGEDKTKDFGTRYEAIERKKLNDEKANEDEYVRLARISLETYIKTGKRAYLPHWVPQKMLNTRAGTFVSLKKYGQLRGCIGTTAATRSSVAEEIMQNAISAAVDDPRFDTVREDELGELTYSVDVLGETEEIDSPDKLDVKRYGVIVQNGGRRGLLLPNLEGVNSVEKQIAISKQKADIRPEEPVRLFRFEVVRHT
ncbi:MAG: AmmeMemoRadiSam system protein A [Eubacteriales bacterium]